MIAHGYSDDIQLNEGNRIIYDTGVSTTFTYKSNLFILESNGSFSLFLLPG
jgi:hypothetical protein